MSFLYPLLWLAALGAAVPLWLHLRQHRPYDLRPFSALRFLDEEPHPRRGSYRLRDPWLLLLRLLAFLLIVAAFAWPYLREAAPVVTTSRVHLLDDTLSQQVGGGFEDDRDAVVRALAESPSNVQNAVVVVAARPRVEVTFGDDRESALRRLRALEPSYERGSYLEAFRLASTLLEQSLGEVREIVVHGDFQANQWSEHRASPPFLRGIRVTLDGRPGDGGAANAALHEPRTRFFFLGEKTVVDLNVDLAHQGPIEDAAVTIDANGRRVLDQAVKVRGRPPVLSLKAQWVTDPQHWLEGVARVRGRGDVLPGDDETYFCVPPVREGRLALLVRSPYLRLALSPEIMRGRWASERLNPAEVDPDAPLGELADVLVVESSYVQSERVRALLLRYLNNERGVVLFVDRTTPLVHGFLRDLGFEVVESTRQVTQSFRYFNVYHPIFRPFADGGLGDLMTVQVKRYVPMRSASARPLLYGSAGGGLLAEGLKTKGRLLLFTFGLDLEQTDWPIQPSFIPFLDLTLQYARAATELETSERPGELYALELPQGRQVRRLALRRRAGDGEAGEEVLRLDVADGEEEARFYVPDRPGIYGLHLDDDVEPYSLLAVNPAREESELAYDADPEALAAWTFAEDPGERPERRPAAEIVPETEILRQRLWWWLAAAGLALLTLETGWLLRRQEAS